LPIPVLTGCNCENVAKEVKYFIKTTSQSITKIYVDVVLTTINSATCTEQLVFKQYFSAEFISDIKFPS